MLPYKTMDLSNSIRNNTETLAKQRQLSSSSISEKVNHYTRPPSYTFYQPTHSYSNVTPNTNKHNQKREYQFVSEYFGGNKLVGSRPPSNQSSDSQKNQNQQKSYRYKFLNSLPKIETPTNKNKEQNGFSSVSSAVNSPFTIQKDTTNYSKLQVRRIHSYEQKKQINPSKAQSTLVQQKSEVSEDKSKSKQNSLKNSSHLLPNLLIQSTVSLESLSQAELLKKYQILQTKKIQPENRNYNLAQQLLKSQSLSRRYEEKCQELNQCVQKYKKSEQSLKISRNIISTLNQKIVRSSRQNETAITNLQQKYHLQILDLKQSHEEESKKLQSTIFELKLNVIDQTNAMEQALSKAKEQFKINWNKQQSIYQNQINEMVNIAIINQNEIRRLNEVIVILESDLMKLDQHNMNMNQQIEHFLLQKKISQEMIINLRQENQTLVQQISHTHLFLQDLKTENLVLKQKQQQIIQIKQKNNNNLHSTDEEKGFLMSNISNCEGQIKNLVQKLDQFKIQTTLLKNQKEQLLEQLQQKEGQIAKLNITKGSLMLQNLKFKEKFKKSTSPELSTTQHDVQSQQITNLKSQIAQLKAQLERTKAQLETAKAQNQQKKISLSQKYTEVNILNSRVKQREEELKRLQDQYLIQKEQHQFILNTRQNQWSTHYEELRKQLQSTIVKSRNIQSFIQQKSVKDQHDYSLRLEEKEQKINLLFQQLQRSSRHIEQQTAQIIYLRQQIASSKQEQELLTQMQLLNNELQNKLIEQSIMQESNQIQFNKAVDELNTRIKQLEYIIEATKQQYLILIEKERESKQSIDDFQKKRIADLELQLKNCIQVIEKQNIRIEQLSVELEMQEKDYRTMVEEQINKITMIYSDQNHQLDSPLKPNIPRLSLQHQYPILQNELDQNSHSSNTEPQTMSRYTLINKVRQLQFIKHSLELKVQEISSMQENLNDVIIDKLKNFEVNLEKNQQEKHELQEKVFNLTNQLQMMVEKCHQYQSKIQWVDIFYKEVQTNLSDTIEELIRTQALYFNLKLEVQNSYKITSPQNNTLQEQIVQVGQDKVNDGIMIEAQSCQKKQVQNKEIADIQQEIEIRQQSQNKWVDQMIEEEDPLANYQIPEQDLEDGKLNYYVKETKYGDAIYEIVVSQAHSDSQEEQFEKEEQIEEDILEYQEVENDELDERMAKLSMQKVQSPTKQNQYYDMFSNHIMNAIRNMQQSQEKQIESKPNKKIEYQQQYEQQQEQLQHKQDNPMSNYILNMIKNLQVKQSKKLAEQKKKKEEFFSAFQNAEIIQLESKHKKDVELQQNNNHV